MPASTPSKNTLPLAEQAAAPLFLRLALPNIAATLIMSMLTVVEGWYIGKLGTTALAGVALMFPLYMLTNMLSSGAIGGAVSGAAARAAGAQDQRELEAVLRSAIIIAIGSGGIMSVLLWQFGESLFYALGARDDVLAVSLTYARTFAPGIIVLWLFNMVSAVLRGAGDMRRPAVATSLVTFSHFLSCPLLVFGWDSGDGYGVSGAAAAIPIAYAIGLAMVLYLVLASRSVVTLTPGPLPLATLLPIVRNGLLASNQSVLTITLSLITSALVGLLGTQWLAGYGIGIRLELLMIVIIFGLGGPLITITGANLGAGRRARALTIAWWGVTATVLLVGSIGLLAALFPHLWIQFFSNDAQVIAACTVYLQWVGPCYAFFALGMTMYFISQAFRTLLLPVVGTALRVAIVAIGGYVLIHQNAATPTAIFSLVAGAMVFYGLFVALCLRLGPWAPNRHSTSA